MSYDLKAYFKNLDANTGARNIRQADNKAGVVLACYALL